MLLVVGGIPVSVKLDVITGKFNRSHLARISSICLEAPLYLVRLMV